MTENEPKRQVINAPKVTAEEVLSSYGFDKNMADIEYKNLAKAFKEVDEILPRIISGADPKVLFQILQKLSDFEQISRIDQQASDKDTFQKLMSMANQVMVGDIFDKAKQIGQRYQLPSDYFRMLELSKLDYLYSMDLKYGKFSLFDFYRNRVSSISDRLHLFVDPLIMYEHHEDKQGQEWFRKVYQENTNGVNSAYPNKFVKVTCMSMLLAINLCRMQQRIECSPAATSYQKEACATFNSLYDKVHQTREEFYEILMDPNHPKYQELMSIFSGNYAKHIAEFLDVCLVYSLPNFQKTFRRAKELAKNSSHADIYALIKNTISDISDSRKDEDTPIQVTEMDQVLDFEKAKASDIPETKMSEIEQRIRLINSLSCTLKVTNKVSSLNSRKSEKDFGFINHPQNVDLALDKSNPYTKFGLRFEWSNEKTKENFGFYCVFDTKKGLFEWSFLEDPNDPDFQFVKSQILKAVTSALDQMANELMVIIKEKNNSTPKETNQNTSAHVKTEKIHFHDEVYDIRKSKNRGNDVNGNESVLSSDLRKELSENRIFLKKLKICEPQFWQEENLFKGLSENEIANLKKAMHDYNETGNGDMVKMLSREKSFRLKVGKYRIIFDVIETPSGDKLIPVFAQHRREVYRQH